MSTDAISDASAPAGSSPDAGANTADNPIRRGFAAAREQAQEVSEAMNEKLADLGAAARRTGEKARDYAREQGEKARDFAREQYEARAEQMRRGYSQVKETAGEWSDDLTDYVRENPGRSLLAAAGVGFVIGLLVRGIRRD
jgi:ElaB/YqjD/DUF883 family membrane-anchored ribosome-binding protein